MKRYRRARNEFEDWLLGLVRVKKRHVKAFEKPIRVYVDILVDPTRFHHTRTGWVYLDEREALNVKP
jgi:hypothetical protein